MAPFANMGARPVAAWGAWSAEETYVLRLCYYETPTCPAMTCRFAGDTLAYDYRENLGFGPTACPQLVARAAG